MKRKLRMLLAAFLLLIAGSIFFGFLYLAMLAGMAGVG